MADIYIALDLLQTGILFLSHAHQFRDMSSPKILVISR